MKKVLIIVGGIVVLVGILFGIGNVVKTEVRVERSKEIKASVSELQQEVTNFEKFVKWSPWAEIDPEVTHEFNDAQGEVGAKFNWSGNDEVGTGYQEVVSITEDEVKMKLVFTAPWEDESEVYYKFEPKGESTLMTWGYSGELPLIASLFMDMEEMLGGQYENGLNSLSEKY